MSRSPSPRGVDRGCSAVPGPGRGRPAEEERRGGRGHAGRAAALAAALGALAFASAGPRGARADPPARGGEAFYRLPQGRAARWAPGPAGGVPRFQEQCGPALAPSGGRDDAAAIQAALNGCGSGRYVLLRPGTFLVNSQTIQVPSNVVLRGSGGPGAGASRSILQAGPSLAGPIVAIGFYRNALPLGAFVSCSQDAVQGATSVAVDTVLPFRVGDLVLVDELVDPGDDTGRWILAAPGGAISLRFPYAEYNPQKSPRGDPSRGWFSREDRPVAQIMEIGAIRGNTLEFTSPFHITFDRAHRAQVSTFKDVYTGGVSATPIRNAGVEDLVVSGLPPPGSSVQNNNIDVAYAKYCWVKNVESTQSNGFSVGLDQAFRCVVRDSFFHSTINPSPGGGGYGIEFSWGSADNLVENNISWNFNKVMVMRASGGGNVIAYNYMDDGWINYQPSFVEVGLNASHMTCPHYELFEGNLAFNFDGENTWGNSTFITVYRNLLTGHRAAWPPLDAYTFRGAGRPLAYADVGNRRAIGIAYGHVFYTFVGNVLGYQDMPLAPQKRGFAGANAYPWSWDPVPMWQLGYDASGNWGPADANVLATVVRDGNFDFATRSVHWDGAPARLPDSLYLSGKPAFFGNLPWPWVDGANPASPYQAHPYTYRGHSYAGFSLPAYLRFLQLSGVAP